MKLDLPDIGLILTMGTVRLNTTVSAGNEGIGGVGQIPVNEDSSAIMSSFLPLFWLPEECTRRIGA